MFFARLTMAQRLILLPPYQKIVVRKVVPQMKALATGEATVAMSFVQPGNQDEQRRQSRQQTNDACAP